MTAAAAVSVAEALAEIDRWATEEGERQQTEILEADQEIKALRKTLSNLEQQLETLQTYRTELGDKSRALDRDRTTRAQRALVEALTAQREALAAREEEVAAAGEARADAVVEIDPEAPLGALMEEYKTFKATVEPTLEALPDSYRTAVLKHHGSVADKLRDHFAAVMGVPLEVEAEAIAVDLALAVDAPDDGPPVGLVLLLPVHEAVYGAWEERPDGLGLWIACRVVQAIYEAAQATGFAGAEVVAGGHEGLLVIELDLTGAELGYIEALEAQLSETLGGAPELAGAAVRVAARRVPIDYVVPDPGAGEQAEAASGGASGDPSVGSSAEGSPESSDEDSPENSPDSSFANAPEGGLAAEPPNA